MISSEVNDIRLSEEAYQRLLAFYRRFCEGELGAHYGMGHLLYACHAAFPLLLSPEMANLIWVNFKDISYSNGGAGKIEPVAVADLLLSPLCRQTAHDRYEMNAGIRTYLLQLLRDGGWFSLFGIKTGGEGRLHELASFVWQYSTGSSEKGYDASRIRQLNEWAALAWLNPGLLAEKIAQVLENNDSTDNRNGQLWLHNQMDRLNSQLSSNIVEEGAGAGSLLPFYNLYHYSKAKKDELMNRPPDTVYESARQIMADGGGAGGAQRLIRVKLSRPVAERTQRKLKDIQRVLVLDFSGTIRILDSLISKMAAYAGFEFITSSLLSTPPASNISRVQQMIQATRAIANPEDIILIYIPTDLPDLAYIGNILGQLDSSPAQAVLITGRLLLGDQRTANTILLGTDPADIGFREVENLIASCPGITYGDLIIWLRFQQELTISPMPLLLAPPGTSHYRWLSKRQHFRGGKGLLVFNYLEDHWQVVPEAFQMLPRSTNSTPYDYDTQEPAGDRIGELVAGSRGENFYAGETDHLDKSNLYLVGVERQPFRANVYCIDGIAKEESDHLMQLLREVLTLADDQGYSYWDGRRIDLSVRITETFDPDHITDILDPGEFAIQIRASPTRKYNLFYREEKSFTGANGIMSLTETDEAPLRQELQLLTRYYYLKYLDQPAGPLRTSFNFEVNYWWIRPEGNASTDGGQTMVLDENAVRWIDGEVLVYPFGVEVYNRESFDLYYAVYLLCSDLNIWKLYDQQVDSLDKQQLVQPGMVRPGESAMVQFDNVWVLIQIGRRQLDASIKILLSRDPIEIDFSQSSLHF